MKEIYVEIYEREGNDSWLMDKIQIVKEDGELSLRHKIHHQGWGGDVKEVYTIDLEDFDSIEAKQKRIKEYMEGQILIPEMKIPNLKEILNG